jgi:tRNA threonylcarbamoyl adenosine modification protein (Sua5/YciO/YrdC/YwlC family)
MILKLHEQNPSDRKLQTIVEILKKGGVIIYPTDTMYGIACDIYNSDGLEKIARMKGISSKEAKFSFICKDISDISDYTRPISNPVFKMMKKVLPGPYTFLLTANNKVPKQIQDKKKTVGIRIPDNNIARAIVEQLGNPIMSTSLPLSDDDDQEYVTNPELMLEKFKSQVDAVVDGGPGEFAQSTIIDCTKDESYVIREGKGEVRTLLAR